MGKHEKPTKQSKIGEIFKDLLVGIASGAIVELIAQLLRK